MLVSGSIVSTPCLPERSPTSQAKGLVWKSSGVQVYAPAAFSSVEEDATQESAPPLTRHSSRSVWAEQAMVGSQWPEVAEASHPSPHCEVIEGWFHSVWMWYLSPSAMQDSPPGSAATSASVKSR